MAGDGGFGGVMALVLAFRAFEQAAYQVCSSATWLWWNRA